MYMWLIQLRPNISVSKAVQLFKGGSSKVIREEFPNLREFLLGDSF
jgi:REP element-mobilizing transposase RayT